MILHIMLNHMSPPQANTYKWNIYILGNTKSLYMNSIEDTMKELRRDQRYLSLLLLAINLLVDKINTHTQTQCTWHFIDNQFDVEIIMN